jgi:hypothetical protein
MAASGIDVKAFQAHSLRGAAATYFLSRGVSQTLTRQRGGWTNPGSFEKHYARLHQQVDWSLCLSQGSNPDTVVPPGGPAPPFGNPGGKEMALPNVLFRAAKSPLTEPTEEGEGGGDEQARNNTLGFLNANGAVLPI